MHVTHIPYRPRSQFAAYHGRTERWAKIVAHRRAGKTVATINDLLRAAIRNSRLHPAPRYAYVAPTYTQAKDVAWSYLKHFCAVIRGIKTNEGDLSVTLPSGAVLRLYGAENYERLRGLYHDGIVLDEPALFDPRAWPEVIRPTLSDFHGWASFIGTPAGKNWFWQIDRDERTSELLPGWFRLELKASETGILAAEELADTRRTLTPAQYAQEFECSFEAAILGSYYGELVAAAEAQGRVCQVDYDPALPVHTAWDLGVSSGGNTMSIWFWQMNGNDVCVIDFYGGHSQGLDHYFAVLADKPYQYGTDYVPPDARAREVGSGRTRLEYFAKALRFPRVLPEHTVADRINAGRLTLPHCHFDKFNCAHGLEALRQYKTEYDHDRRTFTDRPLKDWASHPADAFGHLGLAWREIQATAKPADPIAAMISSDPTKTKQTLDEMLRQFDRDREDRI